MSELPAEVRGALEPRRPGELTPFEVTARRRNRRWLLALAIPAVLVGAAALAASFIADATSPSVKPLNVPAGFKAVTDGYFAYAVPKSWSTNVLYSDDTGDLDTSGSTGWAAEHLGIRQQPPVAGEARPNSLADFGVQRPSPYQISGATRTQVSGTAIAYRYLITRPGGFTATAVDAWRSSTDTEIWLLIQASPQTTEEILASFRA